MQIKKYRAANMQLALAQVRADLGRDAVILNTRTIERSFLGFRRPSLVEISATADRPPMRLSAPANPSRSVDDPASRAPQQAQQAVATQQVLQELALLRTQVNHIANGSDGAVRLPAVLQPHLAHLTERGVPKAIAARYLCDIHDRFSAEDQADALKVRLQIVDNMRAAIPCKGRLQLHEGRCTIVALLGPTGVGKTTTIAKLAAHYAIQERRKVGLATADTYRIAAVEQLRVYAEIMGLPLEVAMTPGELGAAVAKFHDKDVVFIDTAGRSPQDTTKLHELEATLQAASPDHALLCLSATTHPDDIKEIADSFAIAPLSGMILTKLDETRRPGWILSACSAVQTPLTHVTTGQNVPEDIEVADATRIVSRILGEAVAS